MIQPSRGFPDDCRAIQTYELPYLDPVQHGLLPQSMVARMRKEVIKALSPLVRMIGLDDYLVLKGRQRSPRPLELHRLTSRLVRGFKERYQTSIPEVNAPQILSRTLNALRIPSMVIPSTAHQVCSI
jgi:RNA polymerase I-specific transcription initiation factor RRN7